MEPEVRERFERIEAILENIARRQDRFDRQLAAVDRQIAAAAARQDRFDRQLAAVDRQIAAAAARQDRFDRQLAAAAARQDRFDRQLAAAAARQDRFDRQLQATARLVAEGIKIVRTLAQDTRELKRSQKAFLDSLRQAGNGRSR